MKHIKSRPELEQELREQLEFLVTSIYGYDAGFAAEAKRIAIICRILFLDKGRSKSLLAQLELKDSLQYESVIRVKEDAPLDGAKNSINIGLAPAGLVAEVRGSWRGGTVEFKPKLGPFERRLSFADWWNEYLYREQENGLTRGELILNIADRDGGAHVDGDLTGEYANLSRVIHYNTGATKGINGQEEDFVNESKLEWVLMRQVANEIIETFEKQLPASIINSILIEEEVILNKVDELNNVEQYKFSVCSTSGYDDYISARILFNSDALDAACYMAHTAVVKLIKAVLIWWEYEAESRDIPFLFNLLLQTNLYRFTEENASFLNSLENISIYAEPDNVTARQNDDYGFVINRNKFLAELDSVFSKLLGILKDITYDKLDANKNQVMFHNIWKRYNYDIDDKSSALYVNNFILQSIEKKSFLQMEDSVLEVRLRFGSIVRERYKITHNPDSVFTHMGCEITRELVDGEQKEIVRRLYEAYRIK